MSDTKYNGWTNYETWNVNLWLENDEESYNHWRVAARAAIEQTEHTNVDSVLDHGDRAIRLLAEVLEEEVKDGNPLTDEASLYSDILSANISQVDWSEIARHWIEEAFEVLEEEAS